MARTNRPQLQTTTTDKENDVTSYNFVHRRDLKEDRCRALTATYIIVTDNHQNMWTTVPQCNSSLKKSNKALSVTDLITLMCHFLYIVVSCRWHSKQKTDHSLMVLLYISKVHECSGALGKSLFQTLFSTDVHYQNQETVTSK